MTCTALESKLRPFRAARQRTRWFSAERGSTGAASKPQGWDVGRHVFVPLSTPVARQLARYRKGEIPIPHDMMTPCRRAHCGRALLRSQVCRALVQTQCHVADGSPTLGYPHDPRAPGRTQAHHEWPKGGDREAWREHFLYQLPRPQRGKTRRARRPLLHNTHHAVTRIPWNGWWQGAGRRQQHNQDALAEAKWSFSCAEFVSQHCEKQTKSKLPGAWHETM